MSATRRTINSALNKPTERRAGTANDDPAITVTARCFAVTHWRVAARVAALQWPHMKDGRCRYSRRGPFVRFPAEAAAGRASHIHLRLDRAGLHWRPDGQSSQASWHGRIARVPREKNDSGIRAATDYRSVGNSPPGRSPGPSPRVGWSPKSGRACGVGRSWIRHVRADRAALALSPWPRSPCARVHPFPCGRPPPRPRHPCAAPPLLDWRSKCASAAAPTAC